MKVLIFLAGFISGLAFIFLVVLYVKKASDDTMVEGLTVFEQPAEVISSSSFEVFQVVQNGNALARMGERKSYGTGYNYYGMVVLLLADENTHYYEDQIINVPNVDVIAKADFSDDKELEIQRDIFVFQCNVGCRIGDLLRLKKRDIINGAVEYIPTKTIKERAKTVVVPLNASNLPVKHVLTI